MPPPPTRGCRGGGGPSLRALGWASAAAHALPAAALPAVAWDAAAGLAVALLVVLVSWLAGEGGAPTSAGALLVAVVAHKVLSGVLAGGRLGLAAGPHTPAAVAPPALGPLRATALRVALARLDDGVPLTALSGCVVGGCGWLAAGAAASAAIPVGATGLPVGVVLAPVALAAAVEAALLGGLYGCAACRRRRGDAEETPPPEGGGVDFGRLLQQRRPRHPQGCDAEDVTAAALRAAAADVVALRALSWGSTAALAAVVLALRWPGGEAYADAAQLLAAVVCAAALTAGGVGLWVLMDVASLLVATGGRSRSRGGSCGAPPPSTPAPAATHATLVHVFLDPRRTAAEAVAPLAAHGAVVGAGLTATAALGAWALSRTLAALAAAAAAGGGAALPPWLSVPVEGASGGAAAALPPAYAGLGWAVYVSVPWFAALAAAATALSAAAASTAPRLRRARAVWELRVRLGALLQALGPPPSAVVKVGGGRYRGLAPAEAEALRTAAAAAAAGEGSLRSGAPARWSTNPLAAGAAPAPTLTPATAAAAAAAGGDGGGSSSGSGEAAASAPSRSLGCCAICLSAPADCVFVGGGGCGHAACGGCMARVVHGALFRAAVALQRAAAPARAPGGPAAAASSVRSRRLLTGRVSEWERGARRPDAGLPAAAAAGAAAALVGGRGATVRALLAPTGVEAAGDTERAGSPLPPPAAAGAGEAPQGYGPARALRVTLASQRRHRDGAAAAAAAPGCAAAVPAPARAGCQQPLGSPQATAAAGEGWGLPTAANPLFAPGGPIPREARASAPIPPQLPASQPPAAASPSAAPLPGVPRRRAAAVRSVLPPAAVVVAPPAAAPAAVVVVVRVASPAEMAERGGGAWHDGRGGAAWGGGDAGAGDDDARCRTAMAPPPPAVSKALRALQAAAGGDDARVSAPAAVAGASPRTAREGGAGARLSHLRLASMDVVPAAGSPASASGRVLLSALGAPAGGALRAGEHVAGGGHDDRPPPPPRSPTADVVVETGPPAAPAAAGGGAGGHPLGTLVPHWPSCHLCRAPLGHVVRVSPHLQVLRWHPPPADSEGGGEAQSLLVATVVPA